MKAYQGPNGAVFVVTDNDIVIRVSVDNTYKILDADLFQNVFGSNYLEVMNHCIERTEFNNRIIMVVAIAIRSPEYDELELEMLTL